MSGKFRWEITDAFIIVPNAGVVTSICIVIDAHDYFWRGLDSAQTNINKGSVADADLIALSLGSMLLLIRVQVWHEICLWLLELFCYWQLLALRYYATMHWRSAMPYRQICRVKINLKLIWTGTQKKGLSRGCTDHTKFLLIVVSSIFTQFWLCCETLCWLFHQ